jgi:hypothetical protein
MRMMERFVAVEELQTMAREMFAGEHNSTAVTILKIWVSK